MTVLKRVSQKEMKRRTGFGQALGYALPKEDEILILKGLPKKVEHKVIAHEEEHISKGEEGPFWGALIGGALGLLGASKQSSAAKSATNAQVDASNQEIAFNRESRDQARADYAPWREAGSTALDALMSMTGLAAPRGSQPAASGRGVNGGINPQDYLRGLNRRLPERGPIARAYGGFMDPRGSGPKLGYNVNEMGPENRYSGGALQRTQQPQTVQPGRQGYVQPNENPGGVAGGYNFQTDPGYEFRVNEGQRALERGGAAAGGLLSGGFGRRAIRYGQDYASNEYTNVYNRIASIAGIGQTASQGSAQASQYGGAMMGNAVAGAGNARASGYAAQGNVWGNAIGGLAQLPWDQWTGGGSGGVTPINVTNKARTYYPGG